MVSNKAGRISAATGLLGLYFIMMPTDCFTVSSLGSLLRFFAVLPVAALLLEYRNLKIRLSAVELLQLLFWVLATVSLFYTVDISCSKKSIITLTLNLALVLCMGTIKEYNETEKTFLKKTLVISGWITAILILAFSGISNGRLTLVLGDSYQDANYINGYFIFSYAYHLNRFLGDRKIPHLFAVLFFIVIILLTGSRGALLGFGLLTFVRLCVHMRYNTETIKKWIYLVLSMIGAVLVLDIAILFIPEEIAIRFRLSTLLSQNGTTGRLKIWANLLHHFSNDNFGRIMFGHGYGTTRLINTYSYNVAHNLYIDNLISLGVTGCVLQILIQAAYIIMLLHRKDKYCIYILIGLIGMCLSLSLTSYTPLWNLMMFSLIISKNNSNEQKAELRLN